MAAQRALSGHRQCIQCGTMRQSHLSISANQLCTATKSYFGRQMYADVIWTNVLAHTYREAMRRRRSGHFGTTGRSHSLSDRRRVEVSG